MSYELDYFPPHNCKWKWGAKSLKYSPWVCNLSDQMQPAGVRMHPADVVLTVDLIENQYVWRVVVTGWTYGRRDKAGTAPTAQEAIACAERAGEKAFKSLTPPWILMALENGWRPPLPNFNYDQ